MPADRAGTTSMDLAALLTARTAASKGLVEAGSVAEVADCLAALVRAIGGRGGLVLRPSWQEGVLRGYLAVGSDDVDATGLIVDADLSTPRQDGATSELAIDGSDVVPALFVRMGPRGGGWLFAVGFPGGVPADARLAELVRGVAGEAWSALRRMELLEELAERDQRSGVAADNVAGLTHDLRTPLTSLIGFIRTLQHRNAELDGVERLEYLDIMERQAERLAGLVGDLLTSARIEAGDLRPDVRATVDMATLVEDSLVIFGPEQRSRVRVRIAEGLAVVGDRAQLERVLQNLLDNALKYSDTPVDLDARADGDAVVIRVRDHGPGITDEHRPRLFQRFGRGDGGRADSTGLGLWIVKGIVTAHGGTVTVDSTRGEGSTFSVRLPTGP